MKAFAASGKAPSGVATSKADWKRETATVSLVSAKT
jgi:hypothetical protein